MKRKNIVFYVFLFIGLTVLIVVANLNFGKDSSIRRSFQKTVLKPGEIITVTLDVSVKGDESYYAIEEHIPVGWVVTEDAGGATVDSNILKWVIIQDAQDIEYTYDVQAPSQAGSYDFEGIYMFENFNEPKTNKGDTIINIIP